MGSDLSTSDEWVEIVNTTGSGTDVAGWTLQYVNSSGVDTTILTLPEGSHLGAHEVAIIAKLQASSSRLLDEPRFVTTSMSLLNTKLLLRLRDSAGNLIDAVDDGIGTPFAGDNPSGGTKASMERIDLAKPGTDAENWRTALVTSGFDPGANVFGSPGSIEGFGAIASSASTDVSPSSASLSSVSSISSISSIPSPSSVSSASSCADPLAVQIYVQDGELSGIGHTTVNFQAIATAGSISTAICRWVFSDGYASDSCNPPPHAFEIIGPTSVRLEARNQCGNTLIQETIVTVTPLVVAAKSSSISSSARSTFNSAIVAASSMSSLRLVSALPNPELADTNREWIEIRNRETTPVDLSTWSLAIGEKNVKRHALKGIIPPRATLRVLNAEVSFSLPNTDSRVSLLNSAGEIVSTIDWKNAEEARVYYPSDIKNLSMKGIVTHVVDGDTFTLQTEGDAAELLGSDTIIVRMLGVDAPEMSEYTDRYTIPYDASNYLRALLESKKVELEFDTEIWDRYGRILAYVTTEDGMLIAPRMLTMGLARVPEISDFYRKEEYREYEQEARKRSLGLWGFAVQDAQQDSDLSSSPSVPASHQESTSLPNLTDIRISEVYSSPIISEKTTSFTSDNSPLGEEWIELYNQSENSLKITGLNIVFSTKKKNINYDLELGSKQYVVLKVDSIKGQLSNDGGLLELQGTDARTFFRLSYPRLRAGQSYAYDPSADSFCITEKPTPGLVNICKLQQKKSSKSMPVRQRRVLEYAAAYEAQLSAASDDQTISIEGPARHASGTSSFLAFSLGSLAVGAGFVLGFYVRR